MCLLLTHAYYYIINGIVITKAIGSTAYIILILRFAFGKKYITLMDSISPPIALKFIHWVCIVENVGHSTAFKFITDENKRVLTSYIISYTYEPMESNIHLDYLCGGTYPFIKLRPYRKKTSYAMT